MMSTFITPKSSLGTLCDLYTLKYIIYLCVYVNISIILTLCIQRQSRQRAGKTYHCGSTWNFRGDGLSVVYPNIAGNATDHGQHRHLASRLFFLFGENVSAMFSVDFVFVGIVCYWWTCVIWTEKLERKRKRVTHTHTLFLALTYAHALSFSFFCNLSYGNTESKYALFVQQLTDQADWDIKERFADLPQGTEGGKSSNNTSKIRFTSMALVAPY